jgi:small subunit ribosomal protein S14
MARKSVIERNRKRQQLGERHSVKRAELKKKIKDKSLLLSERFALAQKLDAMPIDGSPVRYHNRCMLTQRARGLFDKDIGISRIMLRKLIGLMPGIRKASW